MPAPGSLSWTRRFGVLASGSLFILLAGCAAEGALPDASDPANRDDAARVAAAVAADTRALEVSAGGPVGDWSCRATLWGRDGDALLADVHCTGHYSGEPEPSGFAGPVRLEAGQVRYAADGSGYADSVRELFGSELGDRYLDQ